MRYTTFRDLSPVHLDLLHLPVGGEPVAVMTPVAENFQEMSSPCCPLHPKPANRITVSCHVLQEGIIERVEKVSSYG